MIVVEPVLGRVARGGEHLGTGVGRVPVPRWANIERIQGAAVESRARKGGFMQWYVLRLCSCLGLGGVHDFEIHIFSFFLSSKFVAFLTWSFSVGR